MNPRSDNNGQHPRQQALQSTAPQSRETIQLGSLEVVPRLLVGLWQLSSQAWGTTNPGRIRREMRRHVEAGYNAFADHYGTAEQIFGGFRQTLPNPESDVIGCTKWCVFAPCTVTRDFVQNAVDERNEKMQSRRVDLLQFHWNDYGDRQYMDALQYLQDIRNSGAIGEVGLVNFDAIRTDEICTQFPGLIVSNQVQFSVIDTRPLDGMCHVCERHGIKLLTYGTLCGGFLAEKWLGEPEPEPFQTLTPSQRKYLDVILNEWGGWKLFQRLLQTMKTIGDSHDGRSISNVATRWVLDHDFVGCVIVGSRLGVSEHVSDNDRVYGFRLTRADNAAIDTILEESQGPNLIRALGDCGAEYRREQRH